MPDISKRAASLGTENAFVVLAEVNALARQGRDIISFCIGQPDFPAPENVQQAAIRAIKGGKHGYTPSAGIDELREAAARYMAAMRGGLPIRPEDMVVGAGAKPFIAYAILSTTDYGAGDEVIYPNPGFPIYESVIDFLGATPVPVPLVESRGFSFDLDTFEAKLSPKTKMVILNSPGNPTGGVIPKADLKRIADLVRGRDLIVMSDEIYSRIYYEEAPESITQFEGMLEKTVILDGFSKTYSMTGWRLGYGVFPQWLSHAIERLMVNSNSCTASFTQRAGIAALQGPQDDVDVMVKEFRRRRDAIVAGLNSIPGFRCATPAGAFYAFPNITGTGLSSKALEELLMTEAGVSCLSGSAFGEYGDGYLRFSYANSLENIEEALARIRRVSSRWTA